MPSLRLANVGRKEHGRLPVGGRVGKDRVPVLDKGVADNVQVVDARKVAAREPGDAVAAGLGGERGRPLPDLGRQVGVAQGQVVDVGAQPQRPQLEVERVDGQVHARERDAGDVGHGRVAGVCKS